jgi:tetratricopeptide (TPR) repeat protein
MTPARRFVVNALSLVLLVVGAAAVCYARWSRVIDTGDAALARGDREAALAAYADAADRFDAHPLLRQMFARDYARIAWARLAIEYRLQRYDAVLADAEHAPAAAAPHFWAGLALFAKSRSDERPEDQTAALMRAEDELRQAVEAAPADWDAKYDFELVTRLASALRKQPHTPPDELMQLLRPQPRAGTRPPRRVG